MAIKIYLKKLSELTDDDFPINPDVDPEPGPDPEPEHHYQIDGFVEGYRVRVIDYDGTILKEERLDTGDTFELPDEPEHEGLIFQEWATPVEITNNTVTVTDQDIFIGPTYTTESGKHEIFIEVNEENGMDIDFNLSDEVVEEGRTIDWGDGTVDSNLTHTYEEEGEYVIKISSIKIKSDYDEEEGHPWNIIKDYENAGGSNYKIKEVRLADTDDLLEELEIKGWSLSCCYALEALSVPNTLKKYGSYCFFKSPISTLICPNNMTTSDVVRAGRSGNGDGLENVVLGRNFHELGEMLFSTGCPIQGLTLPVDFTEPDIGWSGVLCNGHGFQHDTNLERINIPEGIEELAEGTFTHAGLSIIKFPSTMRILNSQCFGDLGNRRPIELDFSAASEVPSLNENAFKYMIGWDGDIPVYGGGELYEPSIIKVPAALYDEWVEAENWSNYADFIVAV